VSLIKFGWPYLVLGLFLGAVITTIIDKVMP